MRPIDADALEKEGWSLHRTIRVDKNTEEYQTKPLRKVHTIELRCEECEVFNKTRLLIPQPERKWIPCSERLPEMTHFTQDVNPFSDDVLVTIRNEYGSKCLLIGFFDSQHGWLFSDQQPIDGFTWKPIAWQPLPDPYKKEGDRNE